MKKSGLRRTFWVVSGASLIASNFAVAPLAFAGEVPQRPPEIAKVEVEERPVAERMTDLIGPINLNDVPAKRAFEWWSKASNVPLVINWESLQKAGVDPGTRIKLELNSVPAKKLLKLLVQQTSETTMVFEITDWYVQLMTKEEANKHPVTRVYDVGDLMHDVQPVSNPPKFDLGTALSNTNSGGGSGGSSSGSSGSSSKSIFGDTKSDKDTRRTEIERSDEIAKMITDTIEPDIWASAGGTSTIKYYRGRLIVHAPLYVHEQIGMPEPSRPLAVNPNYSVSTSPGVMNSASQEGSVSRNLPAGKQTGKPMRVSAREDE